MSRSSAAIVMHISRLFISYSLPKLQIFKILVTIWNFKLRNGRSQQKFHIFELAPWINSSPFHPLKRLKLWEPQSRISAGVEKSKRESRRKTVLCESWRTRVVRLLASKWFSITIRRELDVLAPVSVSHSSLLDSVAVNMKGSRRGNTQTNPLFRKRFRPLSFHFCLRLIAPWISNSSSNYL